MDLCKKSGVNKSAKVVLGSPASIELLVVAGTPIVVKRRLEPAGLGRSKRKAWGRHRTSVRVPSN
jgi:hypothetical protein